MSIKIALAGNPNSGKTTLFNALTGSNQFVGNWPGVTVEKKEGRLKTDKTVTIVDLPGIYSLSPYTLEEVVARNYLLEEKPDVILNIVDGSNIERNLYLTTQLMELGIPVVIAVNMIDVVNKNKDRIDIAALSKKLSCDVVPVSALKNTGIKECAEKAVDAAKNKNSTPMQFSSGVNDAITEIEKLIGNKVPEKQKRFYAVKLFERDELITAKINIDAEDMITAAEDRADDDSESIITNERYNYITSILRKSYTRSRKGNMSVSDKIDRVVTNRILALPIFAVVMFIVYFISITTVGAIATDWANDGVFGDGWHLFAIGDSAYQEAVEQYESGDLEEEPDPASYGIWVPGIPVMAEAGLEAIGTAQWLNSLILDGIIGGVGAVLGFVPQMLILFLMLAFLEACGYMARIAFIMDRIFKRFGLSGKSFIPMLIGTGCGIPGIMASRTIENEPDRRMTIMTTTFMPCGAKLPIIALIAGALFGGAWWVAPSAYFIGIAAIIISGIILKKTKMFAGDPAPFVMELPEYRMPTYGNILRSTWERGWSFIRKAGTIVLLSSIGIWFLSSFGIADGQFTMVEDLSDGFLAAIGRSIAWVFIPLGFGTWEATVATFTGLIAKENVVGTFGVLFGFAEVAEDGSEIWTALSSHFSVLAGYSFLIFNLLCAPCFAAIGAIKREMNNAKWTLFAIGYQTLFAYAAAFCIYQAGMLFTTGGVQVATFIAFAVFALFIYMLFKPQKMKRSNVKGELSC